MNQHERSAEPTPEASEPKPRSPRDQALRRVVGIGSSAGGLEALTSLVQQLKPGIGVAYVIAQHMSPTHKSMLVQLLQRETSLPVIEIRSGVTLSPDHIYVPPPNRDVLLVEDRLELRESQRNGPPKPSADVLLDSIARHCGEGGIAVILSGTGSDGASGVREIKAAGGFVFVQQPERARYDGMPQAAIKTGCVDWILPAERIGAEIAALLTPMLTPQPAFLADANSEVLLLKLLALVRNRTRLDFTSYKSSTVWRRIERRLVATRSTDLQAYLELVSTHPEELERLAKDILISVTRFFRDRDAFEALDHALGALIEKKRPGEEIRVWVPGCATGEEAYTIAILLHRHLGGRMDQYRVQIFATDVDLDAMQIARRGRYPALLLEPLGQELTQRYFQPTQDGYEIIKSLREVVIFARQDLVLDPPFLRLDLISCRNVLIYLQTELQQRLFALFHFALASDGLLLLGRSESINRHADLFEADNQEQRLFRRRPGLGRTATALTSPGSRGTPPGATALAPARLREFRLLHLASRLFMPDCVVVDEHLQVQHVFGNAGGHLRMPIGKVSQDVLSQLPRHYRLELQSLLRKAERSNSPTHGWVRGETNDDTGSLKLSVHPMALDQERLFLIAFAREDSYTLPPHDTHPSVAIEPEQQLEALEHELIANREHLQTLVEELETSNEEMQALTEELQAANEELQATNEELESANEELQSTNEELLTINEEAQTRGNALITINADLESILENVGMPMLVVDAQASLRRFNTGAARLFDLHPACCGASLSHLGGALDLGEISAAIEQVLQTARPVEQSVSIARRDYLLRVSPDHRDTNQLRGAVVTLLDQTERLNAERALSASKKRIDTMLQYSPILVALKDLDGRYIFANPIFIKTLGLDGENVIGKTDRDLFEPEIASHFAKVELEALNRSAPLETQEDVPTPDGQRRLQMLRFVLPDEHGEPHMQCLQAVDITARSLAEAQLRLTAMVIERAAEAVMITDANERIVSVNRAFTTITGYAPTEVIGKTPRILKSGRHDLAFYRQMWDALQTRGVWQGEIENRRRNGELFTEWQTISAITDESGEIVNYACIFSDISEIIETRRRMEYLALHDELTGLPNRTLLLDRLRHALHRAERYQEQLVLMFIDLDNFKDVNDSLGHDVGDDLLRQLTGRLGSCLRDQDTLARLGGDEFTVLIEDAHQADAESFALRIQRALAQPFVLGGNEVFATASIGIAFYPEDGNDPTQLMQSADTAMYLAKQRGRNTYCYHTEELRLHTRERLSLKNGLRHAVENGELKLLYQPILTARDQKLISCEALMRWHHPSLGEVTPSRFIPAAEAAGMIVALTEWLLDTTLEQIRNWRDSGLQPPRVAINISPLHFRVQNLGELILRKLAAHGLPASVIGIEITEGATSSAPELLTSTLRQLTRAGVHVSLDDFGTGYSSLSRLSQLPINTLKIDSSFIDELDREQPEDALEITRAIILMAHSLNMDAVAEGVERSGQLQQLLSFDCDAVQGFLFARPLSADALSNLMTRDTPLQG